MKPALRTRFAPSPTGYLHVGNAYSALLCQQWAEAHQAEYLLRIEDIDHTRCRPHYSQAIIEDLQWLGIRWQGEPLFQSAHMHAFRQAIDRLYEQKAIYPCFCSRREIREEIIRSASAPHQHDAATAHYPGTCRKLAAHEAERRMRIAPYAWRLDSERVRELLPASLSWLDEHGRHHAVHPEHDLIIGRKDIGVSYHLAVVVDDGQQGITHIIRGKDLQEYTGIHRILQHLLGLPAPRYHHHPLLHDAQGRRLAKRDHSAELRAMRAAGVCPQRLRHFLLQECQGRWPFQSMEEVVQTLGKPD